MPLYRKLAINTAIYRFLSNGPMSEKKKILTEIYPPLFYELVFILLLLMLLLDFFTLHEKLFFCKYTLKTYWYERTGHGSYDMASIGTVVSAALHFGAAVVNCVRWC